MESKSLATISTPDSVISGGTAESSDVLSPPRIQLVKGVLGHPQQSMSVPEFDYMNPSLSESSIRYHLDQLCDAGVLKKQELGSEKRQPQRPYVFFELTDDGWDLVAGEGLEEYIPLFRDTYHVVWKPDRILDIEEMPRPN